MLEIQDKESISEVLEILEYMDNEYVNKISPDFLKFLEENKDINYIKHIDTTKEIDFQITKRRTKAILGIIFYRFWSDEQEKKEFIKILNENEIKKQEQLSQKYNYDDLFKRNAEIPKEHTELTIPTKEKWYKKLINTLKKIFSKKIRNKSKG